jgi:hypothetical protein
MRDYNKILMSPTKLIQKLIFTGRISEDEAVEIQQLMFSSNDMLETYRYLWQKMTDDERIRFERFLNLTLRTAEITDEWKPFANNLLNMNEYWQIIAWISMGTYFT